MRLFLDRGADVNVRNQNGATVLQLAAEQGHNSVVGLLLEKGIDINAQDHNGGTALHSAAGQRQANVVKVLLGKEGTDINAQTTWG